MKKNPYGSILYSQLVWQGGEREKVCVCVCEWGAVERKKSDREIERKHT